MSPLPACTPCFSACHKPIRDLHIQSVLCGGHNPYNRLIVASCISWVSIGIGTIDAPEALRLQPAVLMLVDHTCAEDVVGVHDGVLHLGQHAVQRVAEGGAGPGFC
eukprot:scaffold210499_cov37-Prasinocladus_malaysianus.AAC.2